MNGPVKYLKFVLFYLFIDQLNKILMEIDAGVVNKLIYSKRANIATKYLKIIIQLFISVF